MFSRNQKSFQSRRVFLELGRLINNSPATRERKAPQGENLRVFCPETLKTFIVNDKFYSYMTTIRALFSNFRKKGRADIPHLPPLVTHLWCSTNQVLLEISPKRELLVKVFSCEFWKIFQSAFLTEYLQSTISVHDLL